jgi:hypothetical protein
MSERIKHECAELERVRHMWQLPWWHWQALLPLFLILGGPLVYLQGNLWALLVVLFGIMLSIAMLVLWPRDAVGQWRSRRSSKERGWARRQRYGAVRCQQDDNGFQPRRRDTLYRTIFLN